MKEGPTINSVAKTFRVLEFISETKNGCTLTELVKSLALSIGSAQRIINTLIELQYLCKEPKTKVLHLTPRFLSFGSAFLSQSEIREFALPYMKKLNQDLDEVINLGILMNDEEIVYIDRIARTSHVLTTNLQVGTRRPIHLSSIGKVILAFLSETEQRRILNGISFTKNPSKTFRHKGDLWQLLRDIRKLGYYASKSELVDGIFVLAVPILNHQSQAVAGINVSIPMSRILGEKMKSRDIPLLIEAGKNISQALGNAGEKDS
jgi:IclR family pca regulon transcriptional regulator